MLATIAGPVQELPPPGLLLRSPRAQLRATCRGEEVTDIVGPGGVHTLTAERDVVIVIGPVEEVWTSGGDDLVCVYGPSRPDPRYGHGSTIIAGPGDDIVITYGGSNSIFGNDGNDLIFLNGDIESVEGGDGNDHIWALGATTAYLYGDDGNDLIIGSPGGDGLHGGPGNDVILGAPGLDAIHGDEHFDTCYDTAAGANFFDCEDVVTPGLPEAGGEAALREQPAAPGILHAPPVAEEPARLRWPRRARPAAA